MSAPDDPITLECPDCGCELIVDRKTGKVLLHKEAKKPLKDFDELLADLDAQKARAEDIFEAEKAALADKDRLLEEKFKQAMKRAEETPDDEVLRPFDLD